MIFTESWTLFPPELCPPQWEHENDRGKRSWWRRSGIDFCKIRRRTDWIQSIFNLFPSISISSDFISSEWLWRLESESSHIGFYLEFAFSPTRIRLHLLSISHVNLYFRLKNLYFNISIISLGYWLTFKFPSWILFQASSIRLSFHLTLNITSIPHWICFPSYLSHVGLYFHPMLIFSIFIWWAPVALRKKINN